MSTRIYTAALAFFFATTAVAADPFVLVVMDPLSKPLSCDCVQGYAQREYKLLGEHLQQALETEVKVVWFESLAEALQETDGQADLVIGKHSVVLADEKTTKHALRPIAQLTSKEGDVHQTGLIVVRGNDAAKTLADLDGYRVLFGPVEAEEKSSAAEQALTAAGVEIKKKRQRFGACSEAAVALLKLPAKRRAAAVISSYAQPLLEGCGSINKGDLRVVGETQPVPFVTVFASEKLDAATQKKVLAALTAVESKPDLLIALETLVGFVPWTEPAGDGAVKKKPAVATP